MNNNGPNPKMPTTPKKPYFYYGHRRPSQNRPIVYGGLFTNRPSLSPPKNHTPKPPATVNFADWDPQNPTQRPPTPPPATVSTPTRRLSPLSRHVIDLLLRHRRWALPLVADLSKLRRVTPDIVAEVFRYSHPQKTLISPSLYTKFFHWASRQKGFSHTFASYNAFTYTLQRLNLYRLADQVPDLMSSQGKNPSEKQLEILVRLHSDAGRGLRIYHIYQKMRTQFGIRPRVFLYNRILDGLVKTGHLDLAMSVYEDLKGDGVEEEAITFTILAKGLCREGRVSEVVGILERMRRVVCKPDVFAYTAIVKLLAKEGDFDGCLRIWEEMRKDGVVADVMAYATMVNGLCKGGRVEKGVEFFREMKEKGYLIDRSVYGALVEGFVKEGKVEEGCEVLKEMVSDGYRLDLGIYNCLIGGLCEDGRVDKAYKLLQIAVSEGLTLSFETVTPLLAAYVDSNEMRRFFKLVDWISEWGLPVTDHLADFFSVFVGKGDRELKAVEVFEALKSKGYCSVVMYNILIKALHKSKEVNVALSLFEEIKSSNDLEPDFCTYSLMIPCFVDAGDVREACVCYNKIKEVSWTPSVAAYCSLVKGLCKIGEINAAITLVKDCLGNVTNGPMEFKYILTVLNACRSHNPHKVIEVLDEMMEEGYPVDDVIYCAIIHGFCKHASSEEARKVLAIMKNRNLLSEANYIVYEEMLNEHLKKITAGLVLSSLKFFGLESKLKLMKSMDRP